LVQSSNRPVDGHVPYRHPHKAPDFVGSHINMKVHFKYSNAIQHQLIGNSLIGRSTMLGPVQIQCDVVRSLFSSCCWLLSYLILRDADLRDKTTRRPSNSMHGDQGGSDTTCCLRFQRFERQLRRLCLATLSRILALAFLLLARSSSLIQPSTARPRRLRRVRLNRDLVDDIS
jgi:hypothetical protein